MPTPVMTISDLTENINVTQSENKYPSPFPFEKPTETRRNTADICDVTKGKKLAKADYVL